MIDPMGGPAYWWPFVAGSAIAYLIGSVPFGLILTWLAGAGDVRNIGSGNIGASNVLRTGRRGLAIATLILDVLKGAFPSGSRSAISAGHGGGRRPRRGAQPLLLGVAEVPRRQRRRHRRRRSRRAHPDRGCGRDRRVRAGRPRQPLRLLGSVLGALAAPAAYAMGYVHAELYLLLALIIPASPPPISAAWRRAPKRDWSCAARLTRREHSRSSVDEVSIVTPFRAPWGRACRATRRSTGCSSAARAGSGRRPSSSCCVASAARAARSELPRLAARRAGGALADLPARRGRGRVRRDRRARLRADRARRAGLPAAPRRDRRPAAAPGRARQRRSARRGGGRGGRRAQRQRQRPPAAHNLAHELAVADLWSSRGWRAASTPRRTRAHCRRRADHRSHRVGRRHRLSERTCRADGADRRDRRDRVRAAARRAAAARHFHAATG